MNSTAQTKNIRNRFDSLWEFGCHVRFVASLVSLASKIHGSQMVSPPN
jgi:hypothetical protein